MKNLDYYRLLPYRIHSEMVIDSDGSRYWTAEYVDLRGCKTDGKTQAEAIQNVQELFDEYVSDRLKLNQEIPEPMVVHHSVIDIDVEMSHWTFAQAPNPLSGSYKTDRTQAKRFEEAEVA